MDRATLPSIPWIRTLDNEVIGDILYYFSTYHGHEMLSLVIHKLNSAYTNFLSEHPDFNGPISLIAHSLGGLVCYEILYYMRLLEEARTRHTDFSELVNPRERERYRDLPELLFTPNRLFSMGTPLGGTLVFRNLSFSDYLIPASVGYHNIFHPYDPFGYRTEPLVDDYYEDTPAVPITTDVISGSYANSVSRFGNRRMTLGGSMADLGKTFVDAMTTAPATFSSTVIRAAKTSVSMPINAIMNTGLPAHSSPVGPPHHSTTQSSTTATSSPVSGTDEDDIMLSHIMRIFKVSRAPTREQQIAEAQGLPLSSRMVAGHRDGTRASTTAPNEYVQTSRPIYSAHAHSGAAGSELGVDVDLKGSDTMNEGRMLRRYNTMPPVLPLIDYVPITPAAEASNEEEEPPASEEEELPSTNTKLAHRLPYTERMDYIIPFSKSHLQNET
ncbi:hypothetical protein FBU31_003645 [Coemansia sp. 'formosensis']|nr:hypothetical protein FBU31_003645 [Coemansia sp. 'formosensis']